MSDDGDGSGHARRRDPPGILLGLALPGRRLGSFARRELRRSLGRPRLRQVHPLARGHADRPLFLQLAARRVGESELAHPCPLHSHPTRGRVDRLGDLEVRGLDRDRLPDRVDCPGPGRIPGDGGGQRGRDGCDGPPVLRHPAQPAHGPVERRVDSMARAARSARARGLLAGPAPLRSLGESARRIPVRHRRPVRRGRRPRGPPDLQAGGHCRMARDSLSSADRARRNDRLPLRMDESHPSVSDHDGSRRGLLAPREGMDAALRAERQR